MKYFLTFIRTLKAIHTRPTRYFILLVIAIITLFLLAYMHNYNIVYLMMFFAFSLAGASSLIGRFNLYDLKVRFLSHQRFFADLPSSFTLQISNPVMRTSYALQLACEGESYPVSILRARQDTLVTLPYAFSARGSHILPQMTLGSYYPLPHELLYKTVDLKQTIPVYPEPKGIELEQFLYKSHSLTGEQDDFEGIRTYEMSDRLSLIHWPSIAKGTELMSKLFSFNDASRVLHFDFQTCAEEDERRLSQLTLWILSCEEKGISFVVHMPHTIYNSNKMSIDEILRKLADY